MTSITIKRKSKDIIGYTVEGHTGFGDAGEDIVCAAVSSLSTATLNGLTDVVGLTVGYEMREAYLTCILPDTMSEQEAAGAKVLLNTMYLSLKDLEEQYGKYITITELEV